MAGTADFEGAGTFGGRVSGGQNVIQKQDARAGKLRAWRREKTALDVRFSIFPGQRCLSGQGGEPAQACGEVGKFQVCRDFFRDERGLIEASRIFFNRIQGDGGDGGKFFTFQITADKIKRHVCEEIFQNFLVFEFVGMKQCFHFSFIKCAGERAVEMKFDVGTLAAF
jgi:hypothetical protein